MSLQSPFSHGWYVIRMPTRGVKHALGLILDLGSPFNKGAQSICKGLIFFDTFHWWMGSYPCLTLDVELESPLDMRINSYYVR